MVELRETAPGSSHTNKRELMASTTRTDARTRSVPTRPRGLGGEASLRLARSRTEGTGRIRWDYRPAFGAEEHSALSIQHSAQSKNLRRFFGSARKISLN